MSNDKISKSETAHIASLANLPLSEEEIEKFSRQLSETIEYVERLNKLDTNRVDPTSQTTGIKNIFRKDEVKPSLTQESSLSNAKRKHRGYFVTKAVFD